MLRPPAFPRIHLLDRRLDLLTRGLFERPSGCKRISTTLFGATAAPKRALIGARTARRRYASMPLITRLAPFGPLPLRHGQSFAADDGAPDGVLAARGRVYTVVRFAPSVGWTRGLHVPSPPACDASSAVFPSILSSLCRCLCHPSSRQSNHPSTFPSSSLFTTPPHDGLSATWSIALLLSHRSGKTTCSDDCVFFFLREYTPPPTDRRTFLNINHHGPAG